MENKNVNSYSLPVLLYHRIVNNQSAIGQHKIYVYEKDFEKQLAYLKTNGYQTITFVDLAENPKMDLTKKVILTFDDGYEDNYTLLFPLLKKYGFKAVIYLVTHADHNVWGVREGEPKVNMMNDLQKKEMCRYGIEMGGHTRSHVDLSKCKETESTREIAGCKKDVERLTGKKAVSFAYPFGGINEEVKQIARESGFTFAVSTNTGPKQFGEDKFQIRRIEVTSRTRMASFKNKVSGHYFYPKTFLQKILSGNQTK